MRMKLMEFMSFKIFFRSSCSCVKTNCRARFPKLSRIRTERMMKAQYQVKFPVILSLKLFIRLSNYCILWNRKNPSSPCR